LHNSGYTNQPAQSFYGNDNPSPKWGSAKINELGWLFVTSQKPDCRTIFRYECAALHYGAIVAQRTRTGRPIRTEEAQIAAIALTHDVTLVTRNVSDFEGIDGLQIVNPWQTRS
jgi:predicted nucleic acid-binding protein